MTNQSNNVQFEYFAGDVIPPSIKAQRVSYLKNDSISEEMLDHYTKEENDFIYSFSTKLESALIERGFDFQTSENLVDQALEVASTAYGQFLGVKAVFDDGTTVTTNSILQNA